VTAIVGAFAEWLNLPLGEYDMARLAYQVERKDLAMAGGKQDQYAATFGGFNFMEFYADDKVVVNPLRIKRNHILELEMNLLLFYTGASRVSSDIIEKQSTNISNKVEKSLNAMHQLKEQALEMKEALLLGRLSELGRILDFGWQHKKRMADGITNPMIEKVYETALAAGATGGKISGAGGGGHMIFYCPKHSWFNVAKAIAPAYGEVRRFQFSNEGMISWEEK
jgi:D-glycero-alpha-D-manno-heptose-7-phosphate kinase